MTVDDDNVPDHVIVNIAAKRNNAVVVEHDGLVGISLVEWQYEIVRLRERVDMVCRGIAVREPDSRTGFDDEHMRYEFRTNLVHHGRGPGFRGRARRATTICEHSNVLHRPAIGRHDEDVDLDGYGGAGCTKGGADDAGQQTDKYPIHRELCPSGTR